MKKLLLMSCITLLVLSGCGKNNQYYDPQTYIDYLVNTINDTNDSLIQDFQNFNKEIGIKPINERKAYQDFIGVFGVSLSELDNSQAQDVYETYSKNVKKNITSHSTKEVLKNLDEFYAKQTKYLQTVSDSDKKNSKKDYLKLVDKMIDSDSIEKFKKEYDKNKDNLQDEADKNKEQIQSLADKYIKNNK